MNGDEVLDAMNEELFMDCSDGDGSDIEMLFDEQIEEDLKMMQNGEASATIWEAESNRVPGITLNSAFALDPKALQEESGLFARGPVKRQDLSHQANNNNSSSTCAVQDIDSADPPLADEDGFDSMIDQVLEQKHDENLECMKDAVFFAEEMGLKHGAKQEGKARRKQAPENSARASESSSNKRNNKKKKIEQQDTDMPSALLTQARLGVMGAIAMLPQEKREAFESAMESNARVVDVESPIERYLLLCQYNYWRAAERICDYWTLRRDVLGSDRYFLPMRIGVTENGKTAFSPKDIASIKSGVLTIAPPDESNRPVILYNRQNQTTLLMDPDVRRKTIFYFMSAISESDLALMNGYSVLILPEQDGSTVAFKTKSSNFQLLISQAMPVQCRDVHMISPLKMNSWMQQSLNLWLNGLKQMDVLRMQLKMHFIPGNEDAIEKFKEHGFSRYHFPSEHFGGSINYSTWIERRVEWERNQYSDHTVPSQVSTSLPQESSRSMSSVDSSTATARSEQSYLDTSNSSDETKGSYFSSDQKSKKLTRQNLQDLLRRGEEAAGSQRSKTAPPPLSLEQLEQKQQSLDQQHEELLAEQRSLQAQNKLLEAHLARATYLASQYEEDCRKVKAYLERIFAKTLDSPESVPTIVKDLFDKLLLFQGRHILTGQLQFQTLSSTATLLMDDPEMQKLIDDMQQSLPMLSTEILDSNCTAAMEIDEDDIFEDCLSESDLDLNRTISSLRQQIKTLQGANEKLRSEQSFLEGSKVCAEHSVHGFERFKQENLESVGKAIATTVVVTLARTGIHNSPKLLQPSTWKHIADRILSKLLWWWGQQAPSTITLDMLSLAFPKDATNDNTEGMKF